MLLSGIWGAASVTLYVSVTAKRYTRSKPGLCPQDFLWWRNASRPGSHEDLAVGLPCRLRNVDAHWPWSSSIFSGTHSHRGVSWFHLIFCKCFNHVRSRWYTSVKPWIAVSSFRFRTNADLPGVEKLAVVAPDDAYLTAEYEPLPPLSPDSASIKPSIKNSNVAEKYHNRRTYISCKVDSCCYVSNVSLARA